jgi:peptidoglycan/xylan/chitin deacetylase (PgdA/CDA1 family)
VKLPVLQYQKLHLQINGSDTVTVNDFQNQLSMLKENGFNPVTCNDLYNYIMKMGDLPSKPVLITFDEGYISQYEHAVPVLKKAGFHAVFFVIASTSLKSCYSQNDVSHSYMNIEQLKQLQQQGFEIGLQGYDCLNFSQSTPEIIRYDLQHAISLFEKLNLQIIKALAYPGGLQWQWFWKVRKMYRVLQQQKIVLAFTKGNRTNELSTMHRFHIYRIPINGKLKEKNFIHLLKKYN